MKKIVIALLFLLFYKSGNSQVTFDFSKIENIKSKELKSRIEPVKFGEFTFLKIQNINTFIYNVTITGQKMELNTPVPTELNNLFRLQNEDLKLKDEKIEEAKKESESAVGKMIELEKTEQDTKLKSSLNVLISTCNTYLEVFSKLKEEIADIKFQKMALINLAKEDISYDDMIRKLNQTYTVNDVKLKQTYTNFENKYFQVFKKYIEIKQETKESYEAKINLIQNDIIRIKKTIPKDPSEKTIMDKDLESKTSEISSFENKLENALVAIASSTKKIEDGYKELEEVNLLEYISTIIQIKSELENEKNFEVISPLVQMDSDYAIFEISIDPVEVSGFGPKKGKMQWESQIPAKGGLKVDFSVGPIFSIGEGALDDNYYYESTQVDSISVLKKLTNKNYLNPSINAMMHFYSYNGKNYKLGGLFGVGSGFNSLQDLNVNFICGASIILGKYQKVMINGGINFSKTNRIKDPKFVEGGKYNIKINKIEDVTSKYFLPSLFLGLSYNLSKITKR